jgi:hypothetical protein
MGYLRRCFDRNPSYGYNFGPYDIEQFPARIYTGQDAEEDCSEEGSFEEQNDGE